MEQSGVREGSLEARPYSSHVSALTREHEAPASLEHKGLALQQISKRIEFSGKAITDE